MPTGNTSGEFSALAQAIYGSTGSTSEVTAYTNYRSALHLPLSGFMFNGMVVNQNSFGYIWSSTRADNLYMQILVSNTSEINPATSGMRSYGSSMRCVLGS